MNAQFEKVHINGGFFGIDLKGEVYIGNKIGNAIYQQTDSYKEEQQQIQKQKEIARMQGLIPPDDFEDRHRVPAQSQEEANNQTLLGGLWQGIKKIGSDIANIGSIIAGGASSLGDWLKDAFTSDEEKKQIAVAAAMKQFEIDNATEYFMADTQREVLKDFDKDSRSTTDAKIYALQQAGVDTTMLETIVAAKRKELYLAQIEKQRQQQRQSQTEIGYVTDTRLYNKNYISANDLNAEYRQYFGANQWDNASESWRNEMRILYANREKSLEHPDARFVVNVNKNNMNHPAPGTAFRDDYENVSSLGINIPGYYEKPEINIVSSLNYNDRISDNPVSSIIGDDGNIYNASKRYDNSNMISNYSSDLGATNPAYDYLSATSNYLGGMSTAAGIWAEKMGNGVLAYNSYIDTLRVYNSNLSSQFFENSKYLSKLTTTNNIRALGNVTTVGTALFSIGMDIYQYRQKNITADRAMFNSVINGSLAVMSFVPGLNAASIPLAVGWAKKGDELYWKSLTSGARTEDDMLRAFQIYNGFPVRTKWEMNFDSYIYNKYFNFKRD